MPDNVTVTQGVGTKMVTDELATHSGDPNVHLQGVSIKIPTGSEGSKSALDWVPPPPSAVVASNSTTAPLTGNASFVGAWFDMLGYEAVTVIAFSDAISEDLGFKFEYSHDGVTAIDSITASVEAGVAERMVVGALARYGRVSYTNGSNGQGTFVIHTIAHTVFSILPPVVGARTMSESSPVTMASDQDPIDVNQFLYTQDSVTSFGKLYSTATAVLTANGTVAGAPPTGHQLIAAPSAGFHLVIKYLAYCSLDTTAVTIAVRPGVGGALAYTKHLTGRGAMWSHEFGFTEWHLAGATGLFGNLSAALSAGGVSVDVEYEVRVDS